MRLVGILLLSGFECLAQVQIPKIYVQSEGNFDSYISAAITKKHTPVIVTQNKEDAAYILISSTISKEASTSTKVLGCLFAYCAGAAGTQIVSVQLADSKTHEIIWAYNVQKASATAYQSTSEAIAKHLKNFLIERGIR